MQSPFPLPPAYAPQKVEVLQTNDAGFLPGTILDVRHARASLLCVAHPTTNKDAYIRRSEVRAVDQP